MAGTEAGDAAQVTVKVFSGTGTTGTPVATLTATKDGSGAYSVAPTTGLGEGPFTAQASQADNAGNSGSSSANTFRIDTTDPVVTLTAPANGSSTNDTTPTFTGVAGTEAGDAAQVTVKVFSGTGTTGTPVATLTATRGTGGAYTVDAETALAQGTYTAQVSQGDHAGNSGVSSANTFTVDTTAPETTISSGPYTLTDQTSATFAFSSNEADSTFECKLDGGAWESCATGKRYEGLSVGAHTFQVRATDRARNTDATPATHTWRIIVLTAFSKNFDGLNLPKAKAGSVLPLGWAVSNGTAYIQPLTRVEITTASLSSCTEGTVTSTEVAETTAGSSGLQVLSDGSYQVNWKSGTQTGCRQVTVKMYDGTAASNLVAVRTVKVEFTK